jgi:hypothetical protein
MIQRKYKVPITPEPPRPPIPLVHPITKKKVKLRLRQMTIAQELRVLPVGIREIQEQIINSRNNHNLSIYDMVLYWNRLQLHSVYWKEFGFDTEDEWIAFYLPEGVTLGKWTEMVELFDKPTFVLVGPDNLSIMMSAVSRYQPGTERRKFDYQAIFDRYCAKCDAFHKFQFVATLRSYVEETYERPLAKKNGETLEDWQTEQKKKYAPPRRPVININPASGKTRDGHSDGIPGGLSCSACAVKEKENRVLRDYAMKLENVIVQELGEDHLPERPEILEE